MSTHKGKPSGINKSEGTGVPSNLKPGDLERDEKLTQEYTDNDKRPSGRIKNPNRNVDKPKATNAHGYKN